MIGFRRNGRTIVISCETTRSNHKRVRIFNDYIQAVRCSNSDVKFKFFPNRYQLIRSPFTTLLTNNFTQFLPTLDNDRVRSITSNVRRVILSVLQKISKKRKKWIYSKNGLIINIRVYTYTSAKCHGCSSLSSPTRNIAQVGDTTSLYTARQKRFSSFNFAAVPPTTPSLSRDPLARPTMGKKQATGQRRFLVIHHYYYVSVSGGAFNGLCGPRQRVEGTPGFQFPAFRLSLAPVPFQNRPRPRSNR